MERIFNFSAGPAMMPVSVLEQIAKDLVNYKGKGSSVMEMSHRSPAFEEILAAAKATLRKLMGIGEEYEILFLQGGASLQFSMLPMNLMPKGGNCCYAETGVFAKKAIAEAKKWGNVTVVSSGKESGYSKIPSIDTAKPGSDAAYLHITVNNTIYGTCYSEIPKVNIPLAADMSSVILGREYSVSDFDLIYAGAQKNMGPAGLTVVILKKSLLVDTPFEVPSMLSYKLMADNDSMYNTPPCFAIYAAGLIFDWVEKQGGVAEMEKQNLHKSKILYDILEGSKLFKGTADSENRSIMNVTFTLPSDEETAAFLKLATSRGMTNLKGHRAVGGIRASIYNAMPVEGVECLAACMKDFEMGKRV